MIKEDLNSKEGLAQYYIKQAEILRSGKPLERYIGGDPAVWWEPNPTVFRVGDTYRIAPERKPIPDYDLTEDEVRKLIGDGYKQIFQDVKGSVWVTGVIMGYKEFVNDYNNVGQNRFTGKDWRESLRELKI